MKSRRPAVWWMLASYRASLHLLPKEFRREFGDEMTLVFCDLIEAAQKKGRWTAARVALAALGDVLATAIQERRCSKALKTADLPRSMRRSSVSVRIATKTLIFLTAVSACGVGAKLIARTWAAGPMERPMKTTYRVEEVSIPLKEEALAGRLLQPESPGPLPAVILIPGYVPGHRLRNEDGREGDEDAGTALARYLAGHGVAVLRVPFGGGTEQTKASLSVGEMATRTVACVEWLRGRDKVDRDRVGVIGQSVGGLIATLAASESDSIAFVVTLATPMESLDRNSLEVLDRALSSGGAPEADREAIKNMLQEVFSAAAKGASAQELRPAFEKFLRAEYPWLPTQYRQMAGKTADEFVARIVDEHVADAASPMFRSLLGYDALATLGKMRCPALLLFAERDFKVDANHNAGLARRALEAGGRKGKVQVISGVDHFFERASDQRSDAKVSPEDRFPAEFFDAITTWITTAGKEP
jgi:uncharacterized protein